jgi:hypothetical protein
MNVFQKETSDITRLYNKCMDQNYRPSNFEKLEAEVEYIRALNEECNDAAGKLMTYSELKTLCEKLAPFKPTPEFKALQERYQKAAGLKNSISIFLKNQNLRPRGGVQEEKLDLKRATDILDSADKLKVTFENLDRFKDKLKEIVNLISEIELYLESDNNFKSIETANRYLEALLNTGLEAPQILKLNQVKDYLEQIEIVDRNISHLESAEDHKKILEHLFKVGFSTALGENLMEECNKQIRWKRTLQHFQSIPETFSIEAFMEGKLPPLADIHQFMEMTKTPESIVVSQDVKSYLESKKFLYNNTKRPPPTAPLKDKIKVAREIYASKIVDSDKALFLKSLQEELRFTLEVTAIMTALNQTNEVAPLLKIFEYPVPKAKQVSLGYIERFLLDSSKFNSLMAFNVLNTQVSRLKSIVALACDAIAKEDFKAIARLEVELRDNPACLEVHAALRDCLEFASWREDGARLANATEQRRDREILQISQALQEEIASLDLEQVDDVCRWYQTKKAVLQKLYSKVKDYEEYERYDKLQKLVHDEKNFEQGKYEDLRLQLKNIKYQVDQIDASIAQLHEFSQYFLVPMILVYLGKAHHLGIRTKHMSELIKKLDFAVESELETESVPGIDALEEKLSVFNHLGIWTPHLAKLTALKIWYKKTDEISEKVIARVTRHRIYLMSDMLNKMLSNPEEYEPKVYPDTFELCIKKKDREDGLHYRPRREKKKNQFYTSRAFDNKPLKTGKELIEEIVFNDLVEQPNKFCICNRGK